MRSRSLAAAALVVGLSLGAWTASRAATGPAPEEEHAVQEAPAWQAFDIEDIRRMRAEHGRPWQEFIRVPDLFTGLYEIPAGGTDGQSPHDADEVYYVLAGRGTLVVEGERIAAGPGSVIYVAKEKEHRFVDVTEDLSVLVFFATPGSGG